jgi:hypothetical protein
MSPTSSGAMERKHCTRCNELLLPDDEKQEGSNTELCKHCHCMDTLTVPFAYEGTMKRTFRGRCEDKTCRCYKSDKGGNAAWYQGGRETPQKLYDHVRNTNPSLRPEDVLKYVQGQVKLGEAKVKQVVEQRNAAASKRKPTAQGSDSPGAPVQETPAPAQADEDGSTSDHGDDAGPEEVTTDNDAHIIEHANIEPFLTSLRVMYGTVSLQTMKEFLEKRLRNPDITVLQASTFQERGGVDAYTGVDYETLMLINGDYYANIDKLIPNYTVALEAAESSTTLTDSPDDDAAKNNKRELKDLESSTEYKAFKPRDDARSWLEMDHVWEVQLFMRAFEYTNGRHGGVDGEGVISVPVMLYLVGVINDKGNLNVTPWSVNSPAKRNLVQKFLSTSGWDYKRHRLDNLSMRAKSIVTGSLGLFRNDKGARDILIKNLKLPNKDGVLKTSDKTILENIGQTMCSTLSGFLRTKLLEDAEESFGETDKQYLRALYKVLCHMCYCMWADEKGPLTAMQKGKSITGRGVLAGEDAAVNRQGV